MAIERDDLRLVWPAPLFAAEGQALLDSNCSAGEVRWLLAEAFAHDRGIRLFDEAGPAWGTFEVPVNDPGGTRRSEQYESQSLRLVKELIRDADQLPRYERRRYWSARRRPIASAQPLSIAQTKAAYAELIGSLADTGYLDEAFGSSCPDARNDYDGQGQHRLAELLETEEQLWPLRQPLGPLGEVVCIEQQWSQDLFYDVIEAMHDLVSRPRRRSWHDYHDGWDYDDFARATGEAVYRWKVNEILTRSELDVRLAEAGEDTGRLVQVAGDDRDKLVLRSLASPAVAHVVAHAVALFRARAATREDKRLAVIALAGLLEERERLLRPAGLLRKDEDALFNIANNFNLRHRNGKQQADYHEDFLEWIFWWYLATIELTNRLLARSGAAASTSS